MPGVRVLHIGKYFPPHRGGMEVFLRSLMAEQSRQGLEVKALVHSSERSVLSREEMVDWGGQKLSIARCARWFTVAFAPISPSFPLLLSRVIREHQPQILHIHMPNPSAFWCFLAPSARRLPWTIHWHSDVLASEHKLSLRLLYAIYRISEKWMLRRSRCIIATSPPYLDTSEPLREFHKKCVVIPLGIEDYPQSGASHSLTKGNQENFSSQAAISPLKILAVGRLTYYKGFSHLLDALTEFPDAQLTLVGDGDEREKLRDQAQRLDLGARVRHIEDCDDEELVSLYQSHDVLCLPSIERTEAFGMVLLEAMRSGLPCIVTGVEGSGMRWVTNAEQTGLWVPPENSAALAEMLRKISLDRDKLAHLRRTALARFDSLFRISAITQSINNVYAKILEPGNQRPEQ